MLSVRRKQVIWNKVNNVNAKKKFVFFLICVGNIFYSESWEPLTENGKAAELWLLNFMT